MSAVTEEVRYLSLMGHFNRAAFAVVAALACAAHFKAMTTDPGAVPPDASPIEIPESTTGEEESTELLVSPAQKGRRLCRRCKSFKPQRAHHCR